MKVILSSGKTVSVSDEESVMIADFLMNEDSDDRFIRLKIKYFFGRNKIKLFNVNDISAIV